MKMLAATMLLTTSAFASSINFESIARGTIVTNQLQAQGILVSGTGPNAPILGEILDVTLGDLGVHDFGGSLKQSMLYGVVGDNLKIQFVLPDGTPTTVNNVSMRVGDGDALSESFRVTFFNNLDAVLQQTDYTTTSGSVGGGVTTIFAGAGVARVEVLGIGSGSGGAVDDLTWDSASVPEPSTLLLGAAGLLALVCRKRRQ
jgi:hypothetical protein